VGEGRNKYICSSFRLKAKAEADGIPYQTLASMILQKYVRGALLDGDAVREVVNTLVRHPA